MGKPGRQITGFLLQRPLWLGAQVSCAASETGYFRSVRELQVYGIPLALWRNLLQPARDHTFLHHTPPFLLRSQHCREVSAICLPHSPSCGKEASIKRELLSATVPDLGFVSASHISLAMISSPVGMKSALGFLATGTLSIPAQRKSD